MSSRTSVELGLTNVTSITTDVITDLSRARVVTSITTDVITDLSRARVVTSITTDVITDLSRARVDECYIYNY